MIVTLSEQSKGFRHYNNYLRIRINQKNIL